MNKFWANEKKEVVYPDKNFGMNLSASLWPIIIATFLVPIFLSSCKVYSFKDVSIPKEVKTIRVSYIENKARIVDPQLSPQLTDKLKQKINSQTRLVQVTADDADYDVQAYISDYSITTSGVTAQQAASNRLSVSVHITFKNKLNDQKIGTPDFDDDVTRNFDFSASLSISDAQAQLTPTIVSNLTDEIFNRLFSNW